MSSNPEKAVSYVLLKYVTEYMDNDVLMLDLKTKTVDAATLLRKYSTDDIIVIDDKKFPIGIVTNDDIINKVSDVKYDIEATTLEEIMSKPLIRISEKATLQDALIIMRDNKVRKLPVISKKNDVVGIIYQTTIANAIREATSTVPRLLSPPVKAVLGNLGFVLQFSGVLLFVPAIIATILGDVTTSSSIYLTTVLLLITGFFLNSYGEKSGLNLQQSSVLVLSSMFLLTLFSSIPYLYVFSSEGLTLEVIAKSFFESASGVAGSGISTINEPEKFSQSFVFFRSYTQLIGGMSFIYLVITAFYPESKLKSMRGFISGKTLRVKELFISITIIFLIYIIIVAFLLYLMGENNIINDVSLAMSTLSTGGFVPSSTIIKDMVWQEYIILMGAMILGALPFTFHYALVKKKFLAPKLGKEVLTYFIILGIAVVLFVSVSEFNTIKSVFYVVSASTTTGLQMESLAGLSVWSHSILIILMLIGGCGFSTAGGVKVFRLFHLLNIRTFMSKIKRSQMPTHKKNEMISTLLIIALFPLIPAITGVYFTAVENISYQDAFFESVSIVTTGGLSVGVVNEHTNPITMIILGFLMIFGKFEIIVIIYIFMPKLG